MIVNQPLEKIAIMRKVSGMKMALANTILLNELVYM